MAPVIRVSEELYGKLESLAIGFDTPANVIERLLKKATNPPPPLTPAPVKTVQHGKPGRITPEMAMLTCKLGDKIFLGQMGMQDGKKKLTDIGMNPASAVMYLTAYTSMLTGRVFKRGMKIADSRRMFDHIMRKYGEDRFRLASKAYDLHLKELEKSGYQAIRNRSFLSQMRGLL